MINLQRFFSKFPTIKLEDITLRDLMLSDKQEYFSMMSDPEVVKFLSDEDVPTTIEAAEDEIKFWGGLFYRKQSLFWAIADSQTNKFMGTVGFNNWNFQNRRAEISYDLMREFWGKGIMTKVLTNTLIFGFQDMDLYRIEARTMIENKASQRVLEKAGFKHEGTQKGYRIIRNEPTDVMIYGITKPDFSTFLA
jgi:[ribosomal protein S5]-alanine N-acetyltransferase